MKRFLFCLMVIIFSLSCYANEEWENHWSQGREYLSNFQFQEASSEFDQAINLMSDEDLDKYPYVLVDRAQNDYNLENYSKVMEDTEKALKSKNLSDHERLDCGTKRIAVLMQLGDEDAAVEEYKKYVIGSPLMPKYDYFKEKVVIRNLPSCDLYKSFAKERMLTRFCEKEEDIHEYGNTWIINRTKKDNVKAKEYNNLNRQKDELETRKTRNPAEIQACVNTCYMFAASANFCCGFFATRGGPIVGTACGLACVLFVETLKQDCETCCQGKAGCGYETFEKWKAQFAGANPRCKRLPPKCGT